MGGEGAGLWLGIPIVFGLLSIVVVLVRKAFGKSAPSPEQVDHLSRSRLGQRRTARGYLAALLTLVPVSLWLARTDLQWALLYFLGLAWLLIIVLTVIGLPVLALLWKARLASMLSIALLGALVGALVGHFSGSGIAEAIVIGVLLACTFSLAASLPLLWNVPLPTNKSLDRTLDR